MKSGDNLTYEETVKKYERIDRIRAVKRVSAITLFAVLLFSILLYAVRIENKISQLSEVQAVVIYKTTNESVSADMNNGSETYVSTSEAAADELNSTETQKYNTTVDMTNSQPSDSKSVDVFSDDVTDNDVSAKTVSDEAVYFVTATGSKYHVSGCSYLSKSRVEITYDEIVSGGYQPCSRCIK